MPAEAGASASAAGASSAVVIKVVKVAARNVQVKSHAFYACVICIDIHRGHCSLVSFLFPVLLL